MQLFFERYHHFVPGMIQALSRHLDTNLSCEQLETIETKTFQRMLNYPFWMSLSRDSIQDYVYQLVREAIPVDYRELPVLSPDPEIIDEAWSCSGSRLIHYPISPSELERLKRGRQITPGIPGNRDRDTSPISIKLEPGCLNVILDPAGPCEECYIFHGNEVYREPISSGKACFKDITLEEMILSIDLKHFVRLYLEEHSSPGKEEARAGETHDRL